MAFPQVAATNTSHEPANETTHTVNLPADISSGDLLLVFFATDGDISFSNLNGFTELFSVDNGTACSLSVLYKNASGSEGSSVDFVTNESEQSAHISWRVTGHDSGQAPEVSSGATNTSTTPDPDSLTPSGGGGGAKDYLWIAVEGNDDDDNATAYPLPDNNTNQDSVSAKFTISNEQWVACTVAVHPAEAAADLSIDTGDDTTATDSVQAAVTPLEIDVSDTANATDYAQAAVTPIEIVASDTINATDDKTLDLADYRFKIDVAETITVTDDETLELSVELSGAASTEPGDADLSSSLGWTWGSSAEYAHVSAAVQVYAESADLSIDVSEDVTVTDAETSAVTPLMRLVSELVTVAATATLALTPIQATANDTATVTDSVQAAVTPIEIVVSDTVNRNRRAHACPHAAQYRCQRRRYRYGFHPGSRYAAQYRRVRSSYRDGLCRRRSPRGSRNRSSRHSNGHRCSNSSLDAAPRERGGYGDCHGCDYSGTYTALD
jgi:hypothetical protein